MTTKIERLLEVQNRNVDFSENGLTPAYMKALNFLWNGKYNAAADFAAVTLGEDPDGAQAARFYRVWIEALAQMEDNASLAELAKHLLERGQETPELRQTFMALRGLIHIELDQAPAVRLLSRALAGRIHNPYCLEFEQLCARRGITDGPFPLSQAACQVDDYLVWNTLAQDLAAESDRAELSRCLRHVMKVFPGAPAQDLFEMHHAFEVGQWQAGHDHAARLRDAFPEHRDYAFYSAVSAFKTKNIDLAVRIIESLPIDSRDSDVDLLNLYGECLAERSKRTESDDDAHRAIQTLQTAARLMRRFGLAIDHPLHLIQNLEEQVGGSTTSGYSENHFRAPKNWMVVLSPRRCEEMVRAHDSQIETLHRPLGVEAAPGDIVLFVARGAHTAKKASNQRYEWRLLSMYRVTSRPYWHPVHRWHSTLELIDRPEHPIPIDANDMKSDIDVRGKRASLPRGHHARFGVFNLDDSAMDIMIAAVKRRSDGIDHEAERRGVALSQNKPV